MHFRQALLIFAAALGLVSASPMPDGHYELHYLEDGTAVYTSVDNPDMEPVKIAPEQQQELATRSAKFSKRRTDCWGNSLDRFSTDEAINNMRRWASRDGGGEVCTYNGPRTQLFISGDVFAYYCVTRNGMCGNLDRKDVEEAVIAMDTACGHYTGSWYGWDGSSELVGKAGFGQQVCIGPFN